MERSSASSSERKQKRKERTFLCRRRIRNDLPEIPSDPKFLLFPINEKSFSVYSPCDLERHQQYALHAPDDLGIPLDLVVNEIGFESYREEGALLEEEDAALLNSVRKPITTNQIEEVPWLRKTKILSNEQDAIHARAIDERNVENDEILDNVADARIVEESFEAVPREAKGLVNPHDPKLKALSVVPLHPDFLRWQNANTIVHASADSIPVSLKSLGAIDRHSAILRSFIRDATDEETKEEYLAHFFPSLDDDGRYEAPRDFGFNLSRIDSGFYAFNITRDGASYAEVLNRIRLSKKTRKNAGEYFLGRIIFISNYIPTGENVKSVRVAPRDLLDEEKEEAEARLEELLPILVAEPMQVSEESLL